MKCLCGKGNIYSMGKSKNKIFGVVGFHIFLFQNSFDGLALVTNGEKIIEVGESSTL